MVHAFALTKRIDSIACERKMGYLIQKSDIIDEESEFEFVLIDDSSCSTPSLQHEEEEHDDDSDDDNDSWNQEEEEEEEEEKEEGSGTDALDGSISVTLSNPNVLDCCLCYESLSVPVFQCENGHMVCSSCCARFGNKCRMCSSAVSYNRCRAIEKVLGSMKVSCFNAEYGCKETLSYIEKNDHEKKCIHVPCVCPISGCDIFASSRELSLHVSQKHGDSIMSFRHDYTFFVLLTFRDETIILQEEMDGNIFILKNNVVPLGNMVDISCIGPNSSKQHQYHIWARSKGSNLKLESFTKNIRCITLRSPSSGFLLIPRDYFGSPCYGMLKLEINIRH